MDSLAAQQFGKIVAIALALGMVMAGMVAVLVPEEAGGDGRGDGENPDLKVESKDITFSDASPTAGDTVTIEAVVHNIGNTSIEHWQITDEDYAQTSHAFSPDGNNVIYSSNEDAGSHNDIWMMKSDGSNHTQLTNEDGYATRPFYSPDSKTIYYSVSLASNNHWDIYKMDSDGNNETKFFGESSDEEFAGDISPDGKEIVFFYALGDGSDIWILDINSTQKRQLTSGGEYRYPAFNNDGNKIVSWSTKNSGSVANIWLLTKNGTTWDSKSTETQITSDGYAHDDPHFSSKGDKIIYPSNNKDGGADSDIWLMDSDGKNHVQLTYEDYKQEYPVFSPDDSKIIYTSKEDGGSNLDIWQLNATATATVRFYDGNPDRGGTLIGTDDIAVWSNATAHASIEWTPKSGGVHEIYVVVDDVKPGDGNWSNNVASRSVDVWESLEISFGEGNPVVATTSDVLSTATADLDNDGDKDILVGTRNGEIFVMENDGTPFSGTWNRHDIGSSDDINNIAIADFDNDGDLDVATGTDLYASYELEVWENDGTPFDGTWTKNNAGQTSNHVQVIDVG
ncbi:MAG: PD40 domain-containing protein, partial [Thermoplasmata archaeon]|nr:PD40 domain-containing protein [Thermoplasmata archaeon]